MNIARPPQLTFDLREECARFGIIGFDLQCFPQHGLGFGEPRLAGQRRRQIHIRRRISRIALDRRLKQPFGLDVLALLAIEHAKVVLRFGIVRVQRNGGPELLLSIGGVARLQKEETELVACCGESRVEFDGSFQSQMCIRDSLYPTPRAR